LRRDNIAYVGNDGLFRLWKEAMEIFRIAVLELNLNYDRYREDFINSHKFLCENSSIVCNNHLVNVGRIDAFLSTRKDLVYKFSSRSYCEDNFILCMTEFMFESAYSKRNVLNFECSLTKSTLSLIVEAANDIPLFKNKIDLNDADMLFNQCVSPDVPLVANNNNALAYFFSSLNYRNIISRMYMNVISTNKLIKSSSGKKYLNQADLSTALYRIENKDSPIKSKIQKWCVYIKKSTLDNC